MRFANRKGRKVSPGSVFSVASMTKIIMVCEQALVIVARSHSQYRLCPGRDFPSFPLSIDSQIPNLIRSTITSSKNALPPTHPSPPPPPLHRLLHCRHRNHHCYYNMPAMPSSTQPLIRIYEPSSTTSQSYLRNPAQTPPSTIKPYPTPISASISPSTPTIPSPQASSRIFYQPKLSFRLQWHPDDCSS